jgi:hypothetical protein
VKKKKREREREKEREREGERERGREGERERALTFPVVSQVPLLEHTGADVSPVTIRCP